MPHSVNRALSLLCIGPFLVAMLGVLIVAGLIATPANCACGAGMPHAHSVFMLPGHHHTANGHHTKLPSPSHDHAHDHSHDHDHGHNHGASASGDDTPRMQEMAGHASDPLVMLVGEAQPGDDVWRRWAPTYAQTVLHEGQAPQPDPGPPQRPAEV